MLYKRICSCGCGRSFWAKRIDHEYLEKSCRNRCSNEKYSNRLKPYREIMNFAIEQDILLEQLYRPDTNIFITFSELIKRGIIPAKSLQVVYNQNKEITAFSFVKYGCEIQKPDLFKIIKK